MNRSRRTFVKTGGLALVSMGLNPQFLARAASAARAGSGRSGTKTLICVFQRGAVDGLSLLVPHDDPDYYRLRDRIAIPRPGLEGGAIDLDGRFGLHPALDSLIPLYQDGILAPIHAVGSPDRTRSHFDAQDYMETGTPGDKATRSGWINRYLAHRRDHTETPFSGVAMGQRLPRALRGEAPALAVTNLDGFGLPGGEPVRSAFEELYGATEGIVASSSAEAFAAIRLLRAAGGVAPSRAEYPNTVFGRSMRQLAQLIKMDVGLEIGFADVGGWDTHNNQGGARGQLANNLRSFALALSAFVTDLGPLMSDVVILTMSEFGRTVAENGNGGTDHGHATAMMAIGGAVVGGRVHGRWPTLADDRRYEARDLAVTTDFRDLFAEILVGHLGDTDVSVVFPGYRHDVANWPGVMRG